MRNEVFKYVCVCVCEGKALELRSDGACWDGKVAVNWPATGVIELLPGRYTIKPRTKLFLSPLAVLEVLPSVHRIIFCPKNRLFPQMKSISHVCFHSSLSNPSLHCN